MSKAQLNARIAEKLKLRYKTACESAVLSMEDIVEEALKLYAGERISKTKQQLFLEHYQQPSANGHKLSTHFSTRHGSKKRTLANRRETGVQPKPNQKASHR